MRANALDQAAAEWPRARKEADFRRILDHPDEFDAVVVSTTEHTHAFATLPALQLKKHVYCEKPLAYNVQQARIVREAAARAGVATQMGPGARQPQLPPRGRAGAGGTSATAP